MADYGNRYGRNDYEDYDSHGDDALVHKREKQRLTALANDAIKKGAEAMDNAEIGKSEKFLGFSVDAGLAAYLSSVYNIAADNIGPILKPNAYRLTEYIGAQLGMVPKSMPLRQTAAVATFVVTAGVKSAADVGKVMTSFSEHKKERQKLVHRIAPVLDDLKGRHSLRAFASVKESDNEVIFSHRQRLSRIAKSQNTGEVVGMAANVIPNVALDVPHFKKMWGGLTPKQITDEIKLKAAERTVSDHGDEGSFGSFGRTFVQATTGQIGSRISRSNQMKLRKELQPYSALEMILELEQQVESNPKASSFQVPKGFQNSNKHPESYPLEEYVSLIFIQHQRDMADIKDDHTQIREALHEDLAKAVKPIATAIRSGNLSVMSLVRLVGERQVIKNKGRAIAEPQEVVTLIKNSSAYVHTDVEEYWKNSPVTKEESKKLIDKLEGEDLLIYLSLIPRAIQEDLGVKKDTIKKVQERGKKNKQTLAELTVTAHQESQSQLKKEGVVGEEVDRIDNAYQAMKRGGVQAIDGHITSPTNPKGVEGVIMSWASTHIKEGHHLGKLADKGRQKLEAITASLDHEADGARGIDGDRTSDTDSGVSRQRGRAEGREQDNDRRRTQTDSHVSRSRAREEDQEAEFSRY